jgi:hypothetical protein
MPDPHTTVTLAVSDGSAPQARVVRLDDGLLTLRLASAAIPVVGLGDPVVVHWPAGRRGRYALNGTVRQTHGPTIAVAIGGEPEIEQTRRFVRGGGGEKLWVQQPGVSGAVTGQVCDLGEQSLRARLDGRSVPPGEEVALLIELDDGSLELPATVLDSRVDDEVEVVFAFQPTEPQAQAIRRHVLRRQVLTRKRTGDF